MNFFESPEATETKEFLVAARNEFNSSKEGDRHGEGEARAPTVHRPVTSDFDPSD